MQRNPDRFEVVGLSAGSNLELVAEQAVSLRVPVVAAAGGSEADLADAIARAADSSRRSRHTGPELLTGAGASTALAAREADVVVNGITGAIGLEPTLAALRAGTTLALANKESLIIGGPLVKALAAAGQIVPVDSEHSAIAQCLRGGRAEEVRRLVVTASGGPFRGRSRAELADVTPEQALAHPNFSMGRVITTNSATLVNKGLEVIEAHLLFDIPFDRIDVVVHPQQMIHSMVEFVDGSTIAQAGPPRMLVPIALGMSWPERIADADVPVDWTRAQSWEFEPLDDEAFPAVALARRVGEVGRHLAGRLQRRQRGRASTPSTRDGSASSRSSTRSPGSSRRMPPSPSPRSPTSRSTTSSPPTRGLARQPGAPHRPHLDRVFDVSRTGHASATVDAGVASGFTGWRCDNGACSSS